MDNLKVLLLKNGTLSQYLVGILTEMDEEPSLLVENCFLIKNDTELSPFPCYTSQRDLFLLSDSVFTILEPSPVIVDLYKKTISK